MGMRFVLLAVFCLSASFLSACTAIKETGKGFIGVSTKILEDKREGALKKSFALSVDDCYIKVKDILKASDSTAYIYADSPKKMIAVYFSATDTTPVGIFFSAKTQATTLVEISSPSTYAKEETAGKIFNRLNAFIAPKAIKPISSVLASGSQSSQEGETDVKEKTGN
jgi:hypothetical protein